MTKEEIRAVLIKHLVDKKPRDIEVLSNRVATRPIPPIRIAIELVMFKLSFKDFAISLLFKEMDNIKEDHSYMGHPLLTITMKNGYEYRFIIRYKGDRRA